MFKSFPKLNNNCKYNLMNHTAHFLNYQITSHHTVLISETFRWRFQGVPCQTTYCDYVQQHIHHHFTEGWHSRTQREFRDFSRPSSISKTFQCWKLQVLNSRSFQRLYKILWYF